MIPKPHEFPLKNLGARYSLESVVPWNHLIPSADETTVSPNRWTQKFLSSEIQLIAGNSFIFSWSLAKTFLSFIDEQPQIQLIAKKIFIFSQTFFEVHKWTAPKISHLLWHWIQVVTSTYKFFYGSVWLCAENIWDEVLYMVGRGNLNKYISRFFR